MAFTEFYCDPVNGANVNGGSDAGSPSMSDTAGTGIWNSGTNVYTSVATNGSVAVGQFLSIYSGAATVAAYTARITAVSGGSGSAWVITLSSTAVAGASPTTASTYKAQCGGAWLGPNAAVAFPFAYITAAATNSSSDVVRVNFKNNATYSITTAITHNLIGPVFFRGYSSSVGDSGRAIIDGGTSGASYTLLTMSSNNAAIENFQIQNNGATGSLTMFTITGASGFVVRNCVFTGSRGAGAGSVGVGKYEQCEAYANNLSNTASQGGFNCSSGISTFYDRCIAHNNSGSNNSGFFCSPGNAIRIYHACIADTNGLHGFNISGGNAVLDGCVAYNNGSAGCLLTTATSSIYSFSSCVFANNGTYGIDTTSYQVQINNCAFFSNSSGEVNNSARTTRVNNVTCAVQPMADPANGNFITVSSEVKGQGIGLYSQDAGSFSSTTVAVPDIGIQSASNVPIGKPVRVASIGTY